MLNMVRWRIDLLILSINHDSLKILYLPPVLTQSLESHHAQSVPRNVFRHGEQCPSLRVLRITDIIETLSPRIH